MIDYSRWNRIEISDDEDDTHPNIDTGSLFRWRHQARLERMEKQRLAKQDLDSRYEELMKKIEQKNCFDEIEEKKILEQKSLLEREYSELDRKASMQPWNVDTISHDSWNKTLINRNSVQKETDSVNDWIDESGEITSEHVDRYERFIQLNESKIRNFAFYSRFDDCAQYLSANIELVCQFTVDYMMLWCLQLKLDEKNELYDHISRQTVLLQMILDLAKTVRGADPRDCLPSFFTKAKANWVKFSQLWQSEIVDFDQRVKTAAEMRIQHAVQQQIESKQQLIGPGGLNAQEVFESLPLELQECFEKRDKQLLEDRLARMDSEQAEFYLQRCIDAGLWDVGKEQDEDDKLMAKLRKNNREISPMKMSSENDDCC
ncbi:Hsp90 co-chaperone Cdc37 [Sarcoptes scabiei]|uniref:Hsp90 chaperone protein kinase-targeting subunit n=1 Tax=Sarcoptes scabiei TaxID=52283 RepID=A0A834RCB7_SARSC|nr:Hsp90 co-chaperone Cdc37 [Sarcoptes scabiei]UXI20885.1 hypothetical protein NH340_JMT06828 [Sarcoptes scabiei]